MNCGYRHDDTGLAWAYSNGDRCPEAKGYNSDRNLRYRERKGQITGVDPIAVERAVMGDRPARMGMEERAAAICELLDKRYITQREIARRVGVHIRTVARHARRRREEAVA